MAKRNEKQRLVELARDIEPDEATMAAGEIGWVMVLTCWETDTGVELERLYKLITIDVRDGMKVIPKGQACDRLQLAVDTMRRDD